MQLALRNIRGETITFADPYLVTRVAGLGLPPMFHATERFAQQDGASLQYVSLQPRVLTLPFEILASSYTALWSAKRDLYGFLSNVRSPYTWIATLPDGTIRHLDSYFAGELSMPYDPEWGPVVSKDVGQFVAYDPTWYDPTQVLWAVAVSGGSGSWAFDLGFDAGFGSSVVAALNTRNYPGTWRAYPVITITGPIDDLVIENVTLGLRLDFTGYNLAAGRSLVLDLRPGYKTVTHSTDGNLPDALTDDSDLGTYHIAEHPYAVGGNNTISISGTGATIATRIETRFYTRYLALHP